jgi:uncharacterized protein
VPDGYVIVRVDARGSGRSAGVMDPFSGREARDLYECIEWAAEQPWCSGIGLCGRRTAPSCSGWRPDCARRI